MTELEKETLELERKKLKLEQRKTNLTLLSIVGSVLGALIVYWNAQTIQTREAQAAFDLKLVEIVMSGTSHEAKSRIDVLSSIFDDRITDALITELDPDKRNWGRTGKNYFLEQIATQPDKEGRCTLTNTYRSLYPGDKWLTSDTIAFLC